nr:MAG: capsid protein [ssDNA virus sp.]
MIYIRGENMVTNTIHATYQEVYDVQTVPDKISVIGIHTPSGAIPGTLLDGFWKMYKKVRYKGCSFQLVPAATLPVDPLQVSYEQGESTVDPREMLNPILFKGVSGEDINDILNQLLLSQSVVALGDSIDRMDRNTSGLVDLYYRALTDDSFLKSPIGAPFRKDWLYPLVNDVQVTRDYPSKSTAVIGSVQFQETGFVAGFGDGVDDNVLVDRASLQIPLLGVNQDMFAYEKRALGWMPTREILTGANPESVSTNIPKIFMGLVILPPAYKKIQFFRVILTHRFEFKEFLPGSLQNGIEGTPGYYNTLETIEAEASMVSYGVR